MFRGTPCICLNLGREGEWWYNLLHVFCHAHIMRRLYITQCLLGYRLWFIGPSRSADWGKIGKIWLEWVCFLSCFNPFWTFMLFILYWSIILFLFKCIVLPSCLNSPYTPPKENYIRLCPPFSTFQALAYIVVCLYIIHTILSCLLFFISHPTPHNFRAYSPLPSPSTLPPEIPLFRL